ncbi:hypothetical protein NDU88_006272 [Pleurodeles waltl]|uniref:Uncharacterized protein n=1 Tax=Pleurodeles waltl TaxID=8319 RepID=A0AAV7LRH6_PLEWA|nr:hypothetical protein NDU88_006272 [Pleurodeles waltl]
MLKAAPSSSVSIQLMVFGPGPKAASTRQQLLAFAIRVVLFRSAILGSSSFRSAEPMFFSQDADARILGTAASLSRQFFSYRGRAFFFFPSRLLCVGGGGGAPPTGRAIKDGAGFCRLSEEKGSLCHRSPGRSAKQPPLPHRGS